MRKSFVVFIITLFICSGLLAQTVKESRVKLGWGLKTGINITHFNLEDLEDNPVEGLDTKWRTGFVFGAFVTVPVFKKVALQPEFLYSSMGGDYFTELQEHVRARYNYFSIPVMAKFNFCKNWFLLAGPQFDMLIQGKESRNGGKFDVSDNLKDFDILATGGLEYWPAKQIFLQARYMRGFNDVDFRPDMMRYYNEGVQLTFGVKLNGKKKVPVAVVEPPPPPPPVVEPPPPPVVEPPKDSDNDGITDDKDKCPSVPGVARYEGCPVPDTDNDGINDEEDKCPTVPGTRANQGCPEIKEEVRDKIDLAANNTYFITGSSRLQTKSFKALDEVVKILNENADLKLTIDGHTDNTGSAALNQDLSQKRAEVVKTYLVSKGIDESRLTATGHGADMPIADNKTAAGREKNRRVELSVNY